MHFVKEDPARQRRKTATNKNYDELFVALQANLGEWFRVEPDSITGSTLQAKRTALHGCAKNRRLTIQTVVEEDRFFVRVVGGAQ
jgi:hypothetical protein